MGDLSKGHQVNFKPAARRKTHYNKFTTVDGITVVSTKTTRQRSEVRVASVAGQRAIVDDPALF